MNCDEWIKEIEETGIIKHLEGTHPEMLRAMLRIAFRAGQRSVAYPQDTNDEIEVE